MKRVLAVSLVLLVAACGDMPTEPNSPPEAQLAELPVLAGSPSFAGEVVLDFETPGFPGFPYHRGYTYLGVQFHIYLVEAHKTEYWGFPAPHSGDFTAFSNNLNPTFEITFPGHPNGVDLKGMWAGHKVSIYQSYLIFEGFFGEEPVGLTDPIQVSANSMTWIPVSFSGPVTRVVVHKDLWLGSHHFGAKGNLWIDDLTFVPVSLNQPPVADAGEDQLVEATGPLTTVQLDGTDSSDPDEDSLTHSWTIDGSTLDGATPTVDLGLGTYVAQLVVDDGNGATATDEVTIVVEDTTAPDLVLELLLESLWPPNGKMVTVATGISATDLVSGSISPEITVESNQGDDADWNIIDNGDGSFDVELRARRLGNGGERVYTLTVTATDGEGNSVTQEGTVVVPHDRGKKKGR